MRPPHMQKFLLMAKMSVPNVGKFFSFFFGGVLMHEFVNPRVIYIFILFLYINTPFYVCCCCNKTYIMCVCACVCMCVAKSCCSFIFCCFFYYFYFIYVLYFIHQVFSAGKENKGVNIKYIKNTPNATQRVHMSPN